MSGLMLQWLDSVASDSRCPNSPLIDFNGEILISFWPRSASKGQIICWGNAGHSVPWSQSIILTGSSKEKRKKEGENQIWWSCGYIHNQVLQACKAEREGKGGVQISPTLASVNMNTNDVFIEWECSANHSWRDNSQNALSREWGSRREGLYFI